MRDSKDHEVAEPRGGSINNSSLDTNENVVTQQPNWKVDPAVAAHQEQFALEALWRVVYSSTLQWDKKLRWINTVLCVASLFNFAVVVYLFQGCYDHRTLKFTLEENCSSYEPSLIASFILFFINIGIIVWYYFEKAGQKAFVSNFPSRWSAFMHSNLKSGFVFEIAATAVQPFPLLFLVLDIGNAQYLILLALFARLYLLLRLLRDYSEVYMKRMFIKQGTRFDTSYYSMDYITVAKTYAYHYTLWVIVIGCAISAIFLAYLMHLCEREYWLPSHPNSGLRPIRFRDMRNAGSLTFHGSTDGSDSNGNSNLICIYQGDVYFQSPFVSVLNALYFIGIAATTTGFGDISPVTEQGKLFAVVAAIIGIAWSSFIVAVFTNKLIPSDFQAYVIDYLARSEIDREKQKYAALMIQKHWRLSRDFKRMEAAGVKIDPARKQAKFTEEMTPIIRHFQSIQRREQSQQMFATSSSGVLSSDAHPAYKTNEMRFGSGHGDRPNFVSPGPSNKEFDTVSAISKNVTEAQRWSTLDTQPTKPPSELSPQKSELLDTAPLVQTRQRSFSYGAASDTASARPLLRGKDEAKDVRIGVLERQGSLKTQQKRAEISAEHALKAIHFLQRQHTTTQRSFNRMSSVPVRAVAPVGFAPAGTGLTTLPVQGYSAQSNAIQSLISTQSALQSYLQKLETKVDQLLYRQVHENMVSTGHIFQSWSKNSDDEPMSTPIFVWYEIDGQSKYGSLYWSSDEFAVQNRLKMKQNDNRIPLHTITDVFLGKTGDSVFTTQALAHIQSNLLFSLNAAGGKNLALQAKYTEERNQWVEQFKKCFVAPRGAGAKSPQSSSSSSSSSASSSSVKSPNSGSATPTVNSKGQHTPLGRFKDEQK